jgi:hypothetical protein
VEALLILFIGGTFVGAATVSLFVRLRESPRRHVWRVLCTLVLIYGGLGFFGQALAAAGGLSFLNPSVEWPVGFASGVVRDSGGRYIVPHWSGRVQVYDTEGRFQRGWFIDAAGGSFKVRVADADRIEVFTARGRKRFLFAPDGTLLQQDSYSPETYAEVSTGPTVAMFFDTPWLLWPFAHPLIGWGVTLLGILGLASLHVRRRGASRLASPIVRGTMPPAR